MSMPDATTRPNHTALRGFLDSSSPARYQPARPLGTGSTWAVPAWLLDSASTRRGRETLGLTPDPGEGPWVGRDWHLPLLPQPACPRRWRRAEAAAADR